MGLSSI
ncbi:hypothetical protein AB3S75_012854, partial [Citrus x aurantiifolia]